MWNTKGTLDCEIADYTVPINRKNVTAVTVTAVMLHIAGLVASYGITNTIVLEIP